MKFKTLSASAAQVYELCEARYKAEYVDRVERMAGSAGSLGSALHEVLQIYVQDGHYNQPKREFVTLKLLWDMIYPGYFADNSRYEEGRKILQDWFMRTEWGGHREVLSTELKEQFKLKVDGLEIPVTYIWDRCDRLEDGSIEVIDYKSWISPVSPEDMKAKLQPRIYAVAAQMKYPEATRIWVTYDQLRYSSVGTVFTVEENRDTYRYLQELARRILASKGDKETLNPECRFCVRKMNCKKLISHVNGGGPLGITDLDVAIDTRAQYKYAADALKQLIDELDDFIITDLQDRDALDWKTDSTKLKVKARGQREIDGRRAATIIGPELMEKYGKIGIAELDQILKTEHGLTADQKSALKQLVSKKFSNAWIETQPLSPIGEED